MSTENIGIDITESNRFEKLYSKYGDKFLEKFCNPSEIEYIKSKNNNIDTIASIFSFKEAISKAIGTGITQDTTFADISITYDKKGAPTGHYNGREYKISASHDKGLVVTTAIGEKRLLHIPNDVRELFKSRDESGHKGTFGKVMIVASSKGMVGAGYLSSMSALRSGSGLVYHYVDPLDNIFLPLSIKHTEVILRDSNPLDDTDEMDAILIGPGLGKEASKYKLVENILEVNKPIIIDADGINILGSFKEKLKRRKSPTILTPHTGEFKRLIGGGKDDLEKCARDFGKEYKVNVILKDSTTYITDGTKDYKLNLQNSAMSTAGSGDVLAGIVTSLIGQGYDPFDGSVLGVNIHSLAGRVAGRKYSKSSTIARDILESLKDVFRELEI